MVYLLFLLQFLLSMALMLGLNVQGAVTHITPEWEWVTRALAGIATLLYAWVCLAQARRERGRGKRGPGMAALIFIGVALVFNWISAISLAPLFMRQESFDIVDVLEDARRETHYTSKNGTPMTKVCDHHVTFRLPDGRNEGMCTDLTRTIPFKVPGKGRLRVHKGLAGEMFLDITPYTPYPPGGSGS